MKKVLFFAAILVCLASSCGNKKSNQEVDTNEKASNVQLTSAYKLNDLLASAEQLTDQKVTVRGFVTHTCKHSGKRCFIVGDDQKTTMKVEAKGDIGGFNRELIGSELAITGVLKERRLSEDYLNQYEKQINDKKVKEDGSAEQCEHELNNIKGMRDWMKSNNKDYYSTYYMDGEQYEVVEE